MGVYSYSLGVAIIGYDYWEKILGDLSLSKMRVIVHGIARAVTLLLVPLTVYMGVFYIHLNVLVNAGPHDNAMSSNFQASLEVRHLLLSENEISHLICLCSEHSALGHIFEFFSS